MYGKNQRALLKFLEKHPDRWHRIKRRKAINAARRLARIGVGVDIGHAYSLGSKFFVKYTIPQMLRRQA